MMDGSGSIGACEFNNGKKALKALMQYEQPGKDAKYAMVTFALQARRDFNFLPQLDAAVKMSGVKFPRGPTNTQAGLAEAFDLFITGKNCSAYCSEISFFSYSIFSFFHAQAITVIIVSVTLILQRFRFDFHYH